MIATRRVSIGFLYAHHEKLIKSAGVARSQCSLHRRSRTHSFARISASQKPSSSRFLSLFVGSSSTGMCSFVLFFFVRLLLIPFSLLLVAFGLGYGRFLCIVIQVWFFVLSIGQEQEMKWKSVFRFRNDFVLSFFWFMFFSFCKEVCGFFLE